MSFDDVTRRILDKLDSMDEKFDSKVDDLCDRTTRMEEKVSNHLTQSERNSVSRNQKIYFVLALVGSYAVGVFTKITNG